MSRLLLAAGAHGSNGRAIPIGTLSSTVWRKRSDAASRVSPASGKIRSTGRPLPRMVQAEHNRVIPSKPPSRAGNQISAARCQKPACVTGKAASHTTGKTGVSDCAERHDRKDVLERAVLASRNGAVPGSQMSTEWRAIRNKTTNSYAIEIMI